ncbi:MAG: hypothetical protein FWC79_06460 [Oscillospiraceae bacterium]|nr:hypothetical protein [Oscillospiraceae bacterium]
MTGQEDGIYTSVDRPEENIVEEQELEPEDEFLVDDIEIYYEERDTEGVRTSAIDTVSFVPLSTPITFVHQWRVGFN